MRLLGVEVGFAKGMWRSSGGMKEGRCLTSAREGAIKVYLRSTLKLSQSDT